MIKKITEEKLVIEFSGRDIEILKYLSGLETTIANATKGSNFEKEEIQNFFRSIREF